jgi:hypothetical protein
LLDLEIVEVAFEISLLSDIRARNYNFGRANHGLTPAANNLIQVSYIQLYMTFRAHVLALLGRRPGDADDQFGISFQQVREVANASETDFRTKYVGKVITLEVP